MANQIVLDYLKKYADKYKLEDLKKKIISSGYSNDDVNEAIKILGLEPKKEERKKIDLTKQNILPVSQDKIPSVHFPWMKVGAISGIFLIILTVLFLLSGTILKGIFEFDIVTGVYSIPPLLFFDIVLLQLCLFRKEI